MTVRRIMNSLPALPEPPRGAAARRPPTSQHRGVILLIVLSMLSLFMVLGVTFVVLSARTHATARAVATTPQATADAILPTERLLKQAAMLLLRGSPETTSERQPAALGGSTDETDADPARALVFEALLVDQYGTEQPLRGTLVDIVDCGPLYRLTVELPPSATVTPAELSGRVVSLLPVGASATSHRIVRAEVEERRTIRLCVTHDGLRLARSSAGAERDLARAGTEVIINNRAHSSRGTTKNEAWDGFDAANPYLAHVEPDPARPSRQLVIRPSLFKPEAVEALNDPDASNDDLDGDGVDDRADNDNDGVFDGWFFDPRLPRIVSPRTGLPVQVHVSCLVLDMDGRLNVNAHGSVNDLLRRADTVPYGSGYGPAEIDGGAVFRSLAEESGNRRGDDPWMNVLLGARAGSTLHQTSLPRSGDRLMPLESPAGAAVEGRYGWQANGASTPLRDLADWTVLAEALPLPGHNGVADPAAADGIRNLMMVPPGRRDWAVDLQARLQRRAVLEPGPVPTMSYAKADSRDEFVDHPYEITLTGLGRRTGLHDPATSGTAPSGVADNPFSPAELERILRPYDPDSPTLPERLAGLLGSQAEASRLVVTTDSWDTAAIVGDAALRVYEWFSAVPAAVLHEHAAADAERAEMAAGERIPNNVIPAELAAGLRIDVARPVGGALQRRLFFKDLYMAAVALSAPAGADPSADVARRCAQWAANVIEYQDTDSTMGRFEYDIRPLDGWDVDGDPTTVEPQRATVWGAERPEVVITQTLAWEDETTGELFVVLNHPWDGRVGDGQPGSAEPVDPDLAGPLGPGSVDLGRRAPAGDPIWRIRCGNAFTFPARGTCLEANQWLVLAPGTVSTKGIHVPTPTPTRRVVPIGGLRATVLPPDGAPAPRPRATFVYLERLADPRADHDTTTNPYLIVDALSVIVADRSGAADEEGDPDARFTSCRRNAGWAQQHDERQWPKGEAPEITTEWEGDPRWFCWPNRPLTSLAELVFVPGFISGAVNDETHRDGVGMLDDHVTDPDDGVYLPDRIPGDELIALDAFMVPSRFAGTRQSIDRTAPYWDALARHAVGFAGDAAASYRAPFDGNELHVGREPGRVNLNTISSDAVWEAVVQGTVPRIDEPRDRSPYAHGLVRARTSGTVPTTGRFAELASTGTAGTISPAKTTGQVLGLSGVEVRPTLVLNGTNAIADASLNPAHAYHTAIRLSSLATHRSHVFGIWITLRTIDTVPGGGVDRETVSLHRMFLLYDRSRPVAFEPGRDHNVRDGIILERVLR